MNYKAAPTTLCPPLGNTLEAVALPGVGYFELLLCWLDFFLSTQHKLAPSGKRGSLTWDNASMRLACGQVCGTFSWLMMVQRTHPVWGGATLELVVLGSRRKQTEQARENKLINCLSEIVVSGPSSRVAPAVSALTSLQDGKLETACALNHWASSPSCPSVFIKEFFAY